MPRAPDPRRADYERYHGVSPQPGRRELERLAKERDADRRRSERERAIEAYVRERRVDLRLRLLTMLETDPDLELVFADQGDLNHVLADDRLLEEAVRLGEKKRKLLLTVDIGGRVVRIGPHRRLFRKRAAR